MTEVEAFYILVNLKTSVVGYLKLNRWTACIELLRLGEMDQGGHLDHSLLIFI